MALSIRKSSWEFSGLKNLPDQDVPPVAAGLVRTRTLSFAQQAMQVLRVDQGKGWDYHTGTTIEGNADAVAVYEDTMETIARPESSGRLRDEAEDARGVLRAGKSWPLWCTRATCGFGRTCSGSAQARWQGQAR